MLYDTLIKTPSPYEVSKFNIPELYSSSRSIDWVKDYTAIDRHNIKKRAYEFVINKHIQKGAMLSKYGLYYSFSNSNRENFLTTVTPDLKSIETTVACSYWVDLMLNTKLKIFFIPLTLSKQNYKISHANMIIVDKRRKCVEFFDPHGNQGVWSKPQGSDLIKLFKDTFVCGLYLEEFCFIPKKYVIKTYYNSCPIKGFQYIENQYSMYNPYPDMGYCVFWNIFLLDLRLSNLSQETVQVQNQYIYLSERKHDYDYNKIGDEFKRFIIEYSNYWGENLCRRNPRRSCR